MKKNINKKPQKGFTLVELLAVIIILAIVIGITIPAVLTTVKNTRAKALQTAADSLANWVNQQYAMYRSGVGLDGQGINPEFINACFNELYEEGKNCTTNAIYISSDFLANAGLKPYSFQLYEDYRDSNGEKYLILSAIRPQRRWDSLLYSRIYIDPNTGKSCVTLVTKGKENSIDFPQEAVACGGMCVDAIPRPNNFCRPVNPQ